MARLTGPVSGGRTKRYTHNSIRLSLKNVTGDVVEMKEYECVEVEHHKDIGKTIGEYLGRGWSLHTYQTAGMGAGPMAYKVNHYLLFERG
jgi:hypothetical protein